ncbi:MAG: site-specific integrase [Planctomyces sp.]|nr:site-specific integrase [Planctomyces sp.]
MNHEINVIVVDRGRRYLYLRYTCPITGERVEKSSGEKSEKEARKKAGQWQAELRAGGGRSTSTRWTSFRAAYEKGKAPQIRETTSCKIFAMFNVIEDFMKPDDIRRITPQWITLLQQRLLDSGRSMATVEGHCRHLKAALNWAREQDLIQTVPKFPRLKQARRTKVMKGRPITTEEFERMLAAVDEVIDISETMNAKSKKGREEQRESIRFLMKGLWLSGLRLGEALSLTWDQWADGIRVDMSGKFIQLLIPAESEKGGKDRVYPVTPDFAEFLRAVPKQHREGLVFKVLLHRGVCTRVDTVSKVLVAVGETAGVKVDEKAGKPVWASAHDLRRAFGFRWSRMVNSMILKELMRHESVTTTEKFYVGIQADETAAMLAGLVEKPQQLKNLGDTSGDTNKKGVSKKLRNP